MDTGFPAPNPARSPASVSVRRLAAAVAVATGLASTGRAIELEGLDGLAGLLCAQMLDLAPGDAMALKPGLVALEQDVAALIALLETTRQ
jgi:hypothetical protein